MHKEQAICTLLLAASLATLTGCNPTQTSQQAPAPVAPVPVAISVPGPVPGTRLTEDYVRRVGGIAYLWGWPMVNMHNRKLILSKLPEPGLMGGIVPVAPINQLSMVRDYIDPGERLVACPEPGRRLWLRSVLPRSRASGRAGAGFRRQVLGLPGRRPAHRLLRPTGKDVRHEARLLPSCRT